MRRGDCSGAIDAFDAALQRSIDATLHRDRGLCHEKLGDAYPAIDDYRAYLMVANDAPDADDIRTRLQRLQDQVNGRSPSDDEPPSASRAQENPTPGSRAQDGPTAAAGADTQANAQANAKLSTATAREKLDYSDEGGGRDTALASGKGVTVGPFFAVHKWFPSGVPFATSYTVAECIGVQFRYAFASSLALFAEAGYQHFNSNINDAATTSGLTSLIGLEIRIPLDADYKYQLFLTPGLGYELLSVSPTALQLATTTVNFLAPRGRIGFRALLQRTVALEFLLDGGVAIPVGSQTITQSEPLVAANVALVWAL
jgi:hypothetical protein